MPAVSFLPAIEIDGDALWDDGYIGNPAIYPLYTRTKADDFLLITINPMTRIEVPQNTRNINNCVNETRGYINLLHI